MVDFIVELFAEIADFFITFWGDNVIDKFAKRNKYIHVFRDVQLRICPTSIYHSYNSIETHHQSV